MTTAGKPRDPAGGKFFSTVPPAGDKYHVLIEGANHFSFVGRKSEDGENGAIFAYVKASSLSFWDAYLMRDSHALEYLKSDALAKGSDGMVTRFVRIVKGCSGIRIPAIRPVPS